MSQQAASSRTANLLQKVNIATVTLANEFKQIIDLSKNSGKDSATVASEVYQTEASTASIVHAAEDLLAVTRVLKEAWILGQVRPQESAEPVLKAPDGKIIDVTAMAEQLLDEILQGS
ncbi:uncharacterized protein SAPINGB_P005592 [Magnusiomyces paraingens]|uniref:Mediator of RNA polymerase II transcription subunit 22 n=1 Tax=Magnusiomyces paraingens TaxID=2606893 RepID=A0A5E8C7M3_9ASCO|nr:uncharacterized protein SAPINGB_P005592 [Saprochaete ingens]VVT57216.1 unnamed protein product [Saprochaete ingens]